MIYAKVCASCLMKNGDIIEDKISKGVILGVMQTLDRDKCYLSNMHYWDKEEAKREVIKEGKVKIGFKQPDKGYYEVGVVNLEGYSSLSVLLNSLKFVTMNIDGRDYCINTNHLISVWEKTETSEDEDE